MITLIISGGQTGADQAGLIAARARGIATGGWAPNGWRTEQGPFPELRTVYGLMEHETEHDYAPRTQANVDMADATVIFGKRSRGSNLTERLCQLSGKPYIWIDKAGLVNQTKLRLWLIRTQPKTLNVAGNRESMNPGIGSWVRFMLLNIL